MKKQKDTKWLDELISRTINSGKPEFDPQKWKEKYPEEFRVLISSMQPIPKAKHAWHRAAQLAVAAAIIIVVALIVVPQGPKVHDRTQELSQVAQSPAEMMTLMSLNIAYRRGGMSAVEKQYQKAFEMLGPRQTNISVQQLMAEFDGT